MNTRKSDISRFNLLYIFVCIIWQPFQLFILRADAAGRSIAFLSILAVLLNLSELKKHKETFATRAFICWSLLICFSLLNSFFKGFRGDSTFVFLFVNYFRPFILLVIVMLELHRDRQKTLRMIWLAMGIYLFLGLPFTRLSYRGRFEVRGIGNLFSLQAVAYLFVSTVLLVEKQIKKSLFIGIALIVSAIILLSGTRKAFGAEVVLLLGLVLNIGTKKGLPSVLKIIVFGGVLLAGVKFSLNNSVVGERINERNVVEEVTEDGYVIVRIDPSLYVQLVKNQRINEMFVTLLDDRAIQYELGLDLFRKNFWTGIGLTNFMKKSGYPYRLHTEYIVQLCENGIIGFTLLILFYVFILRALRKNKTKENSRIINTILFGLLSILFINFTAWTYCQNYTMIVYAIVLNYAYSKPKSVPFVNKVLFPKG